MRRNRLMSDSIAQAEGFLNVEVGSQSVKELRRSMRVSVGPGGPPSDYVPFYFASVAHDVCHIERSGARLPGRARSSCLHVHDTLVSDRSRTPVRI